VDIAIFFNMFVSSIFRAGLNGFDPERPKRIVILTMRNDRRFPAWPI
jgi:hypothetical protein